MGKIRAKKRAARNRSQPTGLPTVEETLLEQAAEGTPPVNSQPLLQRLSDPTPSERRWACQSLSHLVLDHTFLDELIRGRVVRRLTPLLMDDCLSVREAATGALRNMSSVERVEVHQYIAREDIMTPLTAMLKDSLSRLLASESLSLTPPGSVKMDIGMEIEGCMKGSAKGKKKEKKCVGSGGGRGFAEREELLRIIEEGLCLLWNMSENSSIVVEVFNKDNLLPLILQLLRPCHYPPSLVVAAAQLLHTVTEDNHPAIQLLCSSQDHLGQLEVVLTSSDLPDLEGRGAGNVGQLLLIRTVIAGVFQNILPCLPDPLTVQTMKGVLQVLGTVINTDITTFLTALTTAAAQPACAESAPAMKVETIKSILSAQQLAFEVLANTCYTESDSGEGGEGDDEWEDCEVDEVIGEEVEGEVIMDESEESVVHSLSNDLPSLQLIVELGIHTEVCKKLITMDMALYQTCLATEWRKTLVKRLSSVQSSALIALQNLISSLPVESWGGADNVVILWHSLFNLPEGYTDDTFPVVGVLLVLARKMSTLGLIDFLTVEQLHKLLEVGQAAAEISVRADMMALFGIAAKMSLKNLSSMLPMLTVIATSLRDCVAKDPSLVVVSQALDSIFDLFGDDNCPRDLFTALSLLPVLKQSVSTFVARFRIEKKTLGHHLSLVQSAKVNLPRFIDYMSTRNVS